MASATALGFDGRAEVDFIVTVFQSAVSIGVLDDCVNGGEVIAGMVCGPWFVPSTCGVVTGEPSVPDTATSLERISASSVDCPSSFVGGVPLGQESWPLTPLPSWSSALMISTESNDVIVHLIVEVDAVNVPTAGAPRKV